MKKLNKVAALFASAALAVPITVFAQAKTGGDNWRQVAAVDVGVIGQHDNLNWDVLRSDCRIVYRDRRGSPAQ